MFRSETNAAVKRTYRYLLGLLLATISIILLSKLIAFQPGELDSNSIDLEVSFSLDFPANASDLIHPIWTCSKKLENKKKKLIFVHVYKTAGSTLRRLLFLYGKSCDHPYTDIVSCSDLSHESINESMTNKDALWKDRKTGSPCTNKHTTDIEETRVISKHSMKTSDLITYEVDILAGHVSLGVDRYWHTDFSRTNPVEAQYVTFVREPLHRFVSFLLYAHKNQHWSKQEAYDYIKKRVIEENEAQNHINVYSHYLLTPLQKEVDLSDSEEIVQIKENFISYNMLVGVVKHMDESLSLLQSVIDPELKCTDMFFERLQTKTNPSTLSSSELVRMLSEDEAWVSMAKEFLKYEYEVYDFAVKIHKKQYNAMINQYGKKYIHF